ncbi:hypothetical protein GLOTRDRAFT_44832 [Gloeophyllum trabeum ATCC 11539]|uniref:Uncharacterized protein n=1 Tax=Gloeophyllum trabeum (strain ATCC 11539 / FP-39264 / Madison 617) TaxID=670483 RepID=S7RLA7_GLOTA|nr:uncharacterized protein GLOTRDRAFT_44832 [Gloeophyllum trabeum ATCC 11539]EPQ53449.1 hypothetical protein GLOTRDRAFT_44832 [Gloeophyllum trabeum ATCC 11539]
MSTYESLRAAGTSVVCLSPWGDSSFIVLPCIRFRDLAVETVTAATGGTAAIATPIMGPLSDVVTDSVADSILVEVGLNAGFQLGTKAADDLVFGETTDMLIPVHSTRLETTSVKELTITLKYKHTVVDANLGFFRSSVHADTSLFASVKDYLAVEKGWFSPYLFASARRPVIPRVMKPDVLFCHGPFLPGDYRVGQTLLEESVSAISFSAAPSSEPEAASQSQPNSFASKLHLSNPLKRSHTPPPPAEPTEPAPVQEQLAPVPRRLVILIVGLKPHRKLWTTSQRPDESVIRYQLLNGCPAVVVPARLGAPLVSWDTMTLEHLWQVPLPSDEDAKSLGDAGGEFKGVVNVLFEYLDLCVDWGRVVLPKGRSGYAKDAVRDALSLVVAAGIRSGESKEVRKQVDKARSGVAIWRIP